MSEIAKILLFMVSCVLTNNYIFSRFLGCCPFSVSYTHLTLPTTIRV